MLLISICCILLAVNILLLAERLRSNRKINSIIESNRIVLWDYNADTRTIRIDSPEQKHPRKISLDEYRKYISDEDRSVFDLQLKELEEKRKTSFSHTRKLIPEGGKEIQYVLVSGISLVDPKGRFKGCSGVIRDISELIQVQEEFKARQLKAEEADKLKSLFLANMSHEIRTPLNAIVGFSSLMAETEDIEERKEFAHIITQNNTLLLQLIDDILDLSKIESGMMQFRYETFDLNELLKEVYSSFRSSFTNPDIEFLLASEDRPLEVRLDRTRVKQVVYNYLSNSFKHTAAGHILLGYELIDGGVRVYVEDTGKGIPRDKQDRLFKRFEKLDDFAPGTGLGLSICKAIADAMKGRVGFESEEGKGARFWAWFPLSID